MNLHHFPDNVRIIIPFSATKFYFWKGAKLAYRAWKVKSSLQSTCLHTIFISLDNLRVTPSVSFTLATQESGRMTDIISLTCSERNESRSESSFGSRSASWLSSWFDLRAFTSIAKRICALRGDILFLLRRLTHAWLQRAFSKCARTNHVPTELCVYKSSESGRITIQNAPFSRFKSLIWMSFAFTKGKIRL